MIGCQHESAWRLAQVHRVEDALMRAPKRAFVFTQDLIHFAKGLGGHFNALVGFYKPWDFFRQ